MCQGFLVANSVKSIHRTHKRTHTHTQNQEVGETFVLKTLSLRPHVTVLDAISGESHSNQSSVQSIDSLGRNFIVRSPFWH